MRAVNATAGLTVTLAAGCSGGHGAAARPHWTARAGVFTARTQITIERAARESPSTFRRRDAVSPRTVQELRPGDRPASPITAYWLGRDWRGRAPRSSMRRFRLPASAGTGRSFDDGSRTAVYAFQGTSSGANPGNTMAFSSCRMRW